MTTTTNGTIAVGTIAQVECDRFSLPVRYRHEPPRILAVKRGVTNSWLGLFPNPPISSSNEYDGWPLEQNLTQAEIDVLHIRDKVRTHRGWFLQGVSETTADFAIEPEEKAPTIESLQAEIERLKAEHQAFIVKASEILGEQANDHDLCGAYDEIAVQAGLLPRVSNQDVEITVTYRQTVTVKSRTYEQACEVVRAWPTSRYFSPGSPFQSDDAEEFGSPYSLTVELDEPIEPF